MKLKLTMDMDNAAFDGELGDPSGEAARILRHVAGQVEADYTSGFLRDVNGNATGYWEIAGDRDLAGIAESVPESAEPAAGVKCPECETYYGVHQASCSRS